MFTAEEPSRPLALAAISSTGGSLLDRLLGRSAYFRERLRLVVADRPCEALRVAQRHGIETALILEEKNVAFSDRALREFVDHNIDYVVCFYTRLLEGSLLTSYGNRILNLHPSLLPAFSGFHAFDRAMAFGVRLAGTTIHFVDASVDGGKIVAQTSVPVDPDGNPEELRHRLFLQQATMLLQVIRWLEEGRVKVEGDRVIVRNASYQSHEFSPALEFDEAIGFGVANRDGR